MIDPEDLFDISFPSFSDERAFSGSDQLILNEFKSGELTLPPHPAVEVGHNPTWAEDPLDDDNWRFQYCSLYWLERIRVAAKRTDDNESFYKWKRYLMSWISSNPIESPRSDYSWFDMAVGTRVLVLLRAVTELGWESWLVDALVSHGKFLADEANYEGKGNHALHQDIGLLCAGFALENEPWMGLAQQRMETMFFDAVDQEGVSREGSLDYQYRNLRWYAEALQRLKLAARPVNPEWIQRLENMADLLLWGIRSDGNLVMWGDTNEHSALNARQIAEGLGFSLDISAEDRTGPKKFEAGYILDKRTGKEPSLFTARFGPGRATAVHGHDDGGSFTWDAKGEVLLRDSGIFAYEGGEARLYVRGPESHSVCNVRGVDRYTTASTDLLSYDANDHYTFATVESKAMKGLNWVRTFLYVPAHSVLAVDDRITSKVGEIEVDQLWQMGPNFEFIKKGLYESDEFSVQIEQLKYQTDLQTGWFKGDTDPLLGWYSPSYRELIPSGTVRYSRSGETVRFSTLVIASQKVHQGPERSLNSDSKRMRLAVKSSAGLLKAEFDSQSVLEFDSKLK
ncbi:heparinase II/III family protein [Corynebacterium glutamicum]|uniref:heparinase II/III family protein n=1 Tax=Corynebacterium glutamicum TaxID=1718 RepID=UPI0004F813EC|nr:heparinase II/III family protein [Corynebacterium glutamicum]AIK86871.1 hypothetical protein AR0_02270 [Corynebacterium glutamicum]